ncbi:MAG: glycyl radical protein [Clostridia bacterium]|nr:glycyl radical protein [Clostridia bacterium]
MVHQPTRFTTEKSARIPMLISDIFGNFPQIEADRAILLTESYKATEALPTIRRRSAAFAHILAGLPVVIRRGELIVGVNTKNPRSCPTFPEYSWEWLEAEFDTVETREADPFHISEQTKEALRAIHPYWKGKTSSELAASLMSPEAYDVFMNHGIFTVGNYFYNGVGHITVDYGKVLRIGYEGIKKEALAALASIKTGDGDYMQRTHFIKAVIECCDAARDFAARYADEAERLAAAESDRVRREELLEIAKICRHVPYHGARSFHEACQSFWFVQLLIQTEGSGHSISPGRFDQYMYPFYKADLDAGKITHEQAQELIDCIWVKLNSLSKVRDAESAAGFAGYSMFQNLIVGGQDKNGMDATNDLSYMCLEASIHVRLPQPSLSIRVWNGSPQELLLKAAYLTRLGDGVPAYYNDEIIIPALMSRGLSLEEARDYSIIGCVEPQTPHATDGWHDAAFFNMCRPMELVFSNGVDEGVQIGPRTGELRELDTFEKFFDAYKKQEAYFIELMVNADNAVDVAHGVRCPLPFESSMVDGCLASGKAVEEGGARHNFTGPQGFGIANMTDALLAIRELVYEKKLVTLCEYKEAMAANFGKGFTGKGAEKMTIKVASALAKAGVEITDAVIKTIHETVSSGDYLPKEKRARYEEIYKLIGTVKKYGNDDKEADLFAREVAYTYTKEVEKYTNPRGGIYHAGLYPVSANVPLGAQTGATPDGRLAYTPIADGVGPASGRDVCGPTAAANSVAKLDHGIASNGTLFNQKFHPAALAGEAGLLKFVSLIRGFFDQKGMHMQFNVVNRETLLDAQAHPENYRNLVVRVAGYSALFTTLSRSLQDDIIARTEQGF